MTVTNKEELRELQEEVTKYSKLFEALRKEISEQVIGQHDVVTLLFVALLHGGHVLLEGVPGLAKTTMIQTIASLFGGSFGRIQFTPDLLPSDLIGNQIYNQQTGTFYTRKGPVFCNMLLADEINRAPAKVQSALLECMQERQVTIAGESHVLPEPFFVMATQNPLEHAGTYELPEAQKDRFLFNILITYPERSNERELMMRSKSNMSRSVTSICSLEQLSILRKIARRIYVDDKIVEYILDLVSVTRINHVPEEFVEYEADDLNVMRNWIQTGVSPRASLSLMEAAQVYAFIRGRAYVIPDDIQVLAFPVLRHRISLTFEAEAQGQTPDSVIQFLLDRVKVKA